MCAMQGGRPESETGKEPGPEDARNSSFFRWFPYVDSFHALRQCAIQREHSVARRLQFPNMT